MADRLYASLSGFKYFLRPEPGCGANVAKENFALGLLRHGSYSEYHSFLEDQFLKTLSSEEKSRALLRSDKFKILKLQSLMNYRDTEYRVLHFEGIAPYEQMMFRRVFSKDNIPVTRRVYTISTHGHLREFLTWCLLSCGGRPYDSIVVPSRACREALLSYFSDVSEINGHSVAYRGRVDAIGHGIDTERFEPCDDKTLSRKKFGLLADSKIVLSVARLSSGSKMSYGRLLGIFAELKKCTEEKLILVLAGSGSADDEADIVSLSKELGVSEHVRVIRGFKESDKQSLLASADVFVCASDNLQESFGIALVEAMAMGLPVVCTDWSGFRDIVHDGVTGYRVPVKWMKEESFGDIVADMSAPYAHGVFAEIGRALEIDETLFVKRLRELLLDEKRARQMGEAGRARALREFSLEAEISQFEVLWDELGEQANKDNSRYNDYGPVLRYDYFKHFQSYFTS